MKKLTAAVLTLALIFVMAACGGAQKTAYELYNEASEKLNGADSAHMGMDMLISMEMAGETMDISMVGDTKQIIHSETKIDMAMNMTTSMGDRKSVV